MSVTSSKHGHGRQVGTKYSGLLYRYGIYSLQNFYSKSRITLDGKRYGPVGTKQKLNLSPICNIPTYKQSLRPLPPIEG